MAEQLPGRDEAFFFREDEQSSLKDRLNYPGITVVSGRPRTGKSWLVGQVLRHVVKDSPTTLVGFTRCSAQDSDNLMRVIDDLYTRWREQAGLLDQAKEIFNQSSGKWPQLISKAVGSVVNAVSPFGDVSGVVSGALQGLLDLQPGSQAPRLKYEHGQQLVAALSEITQARRIILVLDQWEQSENLAYELEHLRNFTRDSDNWLDTHFIITIRPDGDAEQLLNSLSKGQPRFVKTYQLPEFDTETDADEKQRLITYLHETLPACRTVDDPDDYLKSLQGYVAVLDDWTRQINRDQMQNLGDLLEVAGETQEGRYPEFDNKLPQLDDASRKLCIRLALLPNTTGKSWPLLQPTLMDGATPSCLDLLYAEQLLEENDPPSFGHQSRGDYLQNWLLAQQKNETREQCTVVVRQLAARVRDATLVSVPYIEALNSLAPLSKRLEVDIMSLGICDAAATLYDIPASTDTLLQASAQLRGGTQVVVVALMAMGLFNTLTAVKAEDDLPRRDALLEELRCLQQGYAEDTAVREGLAKGLLNTLTAAKAEDDLPRRDALLEELRGLRYDYAGDSAVREQLAMGLFNTLTAAKAENDLLRRDALLEELRCLQYDYAGDAAVRGQLAMGLFNTLNAAKAADEMEQRNALLGELRCLQQNYPEDAAVRQQLAMGLVNTLIVVKAADEMEQRNALLGELRCLQQNYPEDAAVRQQLAMGLVNTLNYAKAENDLRRHDALLEELRRLQQDYAEDTAVRQTLAMGLVNTLSAAKAEADLPRHEALLEELQRLQRTHPGH